jgi:hypothetical protein
MTFSAYDDSASESEDYSKEEPLDQRMKETGKPLLVMMGAEEQIIDDPAKRLAEYRATVPGARTKLIAGAGHSPNVEKPAQAAALVLGFAQPEVKSVGSKARGGVGSANETQRRRQQRSKARTQPSAGPGNSAAGNGGAAGSQ